MFVWVMTESWSTFTIENLIVKLGRFDLSSEGMKYICKNELAMLNQNLMKIEYFNSIHSFYITIEKCLPFVVADLVLKNSVIFKPDS